MKKDGISFDIDMIIVFEVYSRGKRPFTPSELCILLNALMNIILTHITKYNNKIYNFTLRQNDLNEFLDNQTLRFMLITFCLQKMQNLVV